MKRLLLITGALLLAYVLLTGSARPAYAPSAETVDAQSEYVLKEKDGRVAVYRGGELYISTDTLLSELPKSDANRIRQGISASSEKELKRLIEDICS